MKTFPVCEDWDISWQVRDLMPHSAETGGIKKVVKDTFQPHVFIDIIHLLAAVQWQQNGV